MEIFETATSWTRVRPSESKRDVMQRKLREGDPRARAKDGQSGGDKDHKEVRGVVMQAEDERGGGNLTGTRDLHHEEYQPSQHRRVF